MSIPFQANQKLLFIGDSITDCGRGRPLGQRRASSLGSGYVSFVDSILGAAHPELPVRVLNTGISGNRVTDLEARWQTDVLDLEPNWLSVMIGINDVWRQFDSELGAMQVGPEEYESIYRRLLAQTRPQLDGLVLMTPYFLESNLEDPMRAKMDVYGAITKKLAAEFDAIYVDTQAAFDRYLAHQPTQSLCSDRVHPNGVGHMILARSFLQAVGVS
ncbi:SGNH/GDSL hydrolase family protein [Coraliomargarita algicola]|uniref:SGNH/GDSL hydrolase family protein n=1 Tax=Coraliomargarita algicola TaxID=3092156 RepID=A0ABZ0RGW4_9BACT|nr:SGNH/GDSL hydrolase family protein [Coraliomargarita sp. J2-16]WPJ94758.1 SGNH/GDSL hydrolase family protein [Coraliomargarita sp. J2-16]